MVVFTLGFRLGFGDCLIVGALLWFAWFDSLFVGGFVGCVAY